MLRAHGSMPALKEIRNASIHGLRAKFSPSSRPTVVDVRTLLDHFHPKREAVKDKYSKTAPDTLQWCVVSDTSHKTVPMAAMRNRLKRRWANAFADGLRQNGYHANGRSLDGPKAGKDYKMGLKGTLEMHIYNPSGLSLPYGDLVKSTGALVKALRQRTSTPVLDAKLDTVIEHKGREGVGQLFSTWSMWDKGRGKQSW